MLLAFARRVDVQNSGVSVRGGGCVCVLCAQMMTFEPISEVHRQGMSIAYAAIGCALAKCSCMHCMMMPGCLYSTTCRGKAFAFCLCVPRVYRFVCIYVCMFHVSHRTKHHFESKTQGVIMQSMLGYIVVFEYKVDIKVWRFCIRDTASLIFFFFMLFPGR